jgi:glycosyltransferase involved in cell wall biosynthesis
VLNNNDFAIVWSFRNRYDILERSIVTANQTCPNDVSFYLVDAGSDDYTIKSLRELTSGLDRPVRACETPYRTTVSEAWNLGIMLSNVRFVIFVSSDVEFITEGWFEQLKYRADIGQQYVLIENHAVFMIDTHIVSKMGWVDEGYRLGPHFDTDFMIRAGEADIPVTGIVNTGFYLHGHDDKDIESERVKISDDDDRVKDRLPMNDKFNEDYFKQKWESDWTGWDNYVHPPNHISQVRRLKEEVDPHPFYTENKK